MRVDANTFLVMLACRVQIQFFTWESKHPDMSWWKHFESEMATLAELGVTQVWLPPPNKAMVPVRSHMRE